MTKLGIILSHPIQYYSPWFRAMNGKLDFEVCYAHKQDAKGQADGGFGVEFEWDVPLLEGYPHRFLNNVSPQPAVDQFAGCDTPEIAELIANKTYQTVLLCGWHLKTYRQAMDAANENNVPLMIRGDSNLIGESFLKRLLKFFPYRTMMGRFNRYLYVGQNNKKYLEYYGADPTLMHFVPHLIDNERFRKGAEQANQNKKSLRQKYNLKNDSVVFLFSGRFVGRKRPLDFLQAAAVISKTHNQVEFLMAGDGDLMDDCKTFVAENNIPVQLPGFINQSLLPEVYAASDCLVVPSEPPNETWGLIVNEAMAAGIPSVVSNAVGCAPDMIEEGKTGFVYPWNKVERLTEAMTNALEAIQTEFDFRPFLTEKLKTYSPEGAADGTIEAVEAELR